MLFGARSRSPQTRISVVDGLLILGMGIVIVYYIIEFPNLADRMGGAIRTIDAVFGWFIILLSLEMARRTVGNVIPCIGIFLIIYAYFGPYFPLGLGHSGFSPARIAESFFLSGDGILGSLTNIFASYILIFVILGSFMEVSGCGKVFVDLAYAITGRRTGGPGLASVITSALFGTVSGSAVANVVVDGVYTIPLMKRMGYPAHFAGAVEAATSTGGQFMPPVMGAAAFLLAEISGTPYVQVIKIAAIPACLYFASVGVIIYLEAVKRGLKGMPASELPKIREIMKGIHLLLPIPILIAMLAMDFTPFVGAAVQLINEQYKDKYFFTAAASGGGIENMRRMIGGEFDMTWTQVNVMYDAWNGVGIFEGQKPFKEMRNLMFMGDQTVCVIALAKSPIKTFSDLAGKKISVGTPGSIAVTVAKDIFKALGIQDKVKLSYLSPDAGAQQLKDGHIDAALAPGSPFPSSWVELARSTPVRLIEPTKEEAEKIGRAMTYMYMQAIPPNTAPGENADKPRNAFFWGQYWVAKPGIPDQVIYDIVKVTQEPKNREMLGKVMNLWAVSGPEFGPTVKMGIPIHPGAAKYWMEKGVKLPPELLK